jgi:hypothetical protein
MMHLARRIPDTITRDASRRGRDIPPMQHWLNDESGEG